MQNTDKTIFPAADRPCVFLNVYSRTLFIHYIFLRDTSSTYATIQCLFNRFSFFKLLSFYTVVCP